jgi:hypothetical protein
MPQRKLRSVVFPAHTVFTGGYRQPIKKGRISAFKADTGLTRSCLSARFVGANPRRIYPQSAMRIQPGNDLNLGRLPGSEQTLTLSRTQRDKHLYVCGGIRPSSGLCVFPPLKKCLMTRWEKSGFARAIGQMAGRNLADCQRQERH